MRLTRPAFRTELTSFPHAGADATCLHHARLEVLSPARWRLHRTIGVLCGRETSRGPRPILCKEEAERGPLARSSQVWGRGSPRPADSAIVRDRGAGASVQSPRRAQGGRPMGVGAFNDAASQPCQSPFLRLIPSASSAASGALVPLPHARKNLSRSNAGSRLNLY